MIDKTITIITRDDQAFHVFHLVDQVDAAGGAHNHQRCRQAVRQGTGVGRDRHADHVVGHRIAGAGVDNVRVAPAIDVKKIAIVTTGGKGPILQGSDMVNLIGGSAGFRFVDPDAPGLIVDTDPCRINFPPISTR